MLADVIGPASNVVSMAVLLGVFFRLGGLRAQVLEVERRIRAIELRGRVLTQALR
jgi:hypothetical protein